MRRFLLGGVCAAFFTSSAFADGLGQSAGFAQAVPDIQVAPQTLALTATGTVATLNVPSGEGTFNFGISGLTAGGATLQIRAQNNATTGSTVINVLGAGGVPATLMTTDGNYALPTSGHTQLQVIVMVAGTGSATLAGNYSVGARATALVAPLPPGGNVIGSVTPKTVIYARPAITSGAAAAAQNVFTAGTILTGCELVNTSGQAVYVSLAGTAATTDQPVQPGQSYKCPYPSAQALSVYSAAAWTIAGQVF